MQRTCANTFTTLDPKITQVIYKASSSISSESEYQNPAWVGTLFKQSSNASFESETLPCTWACYDS